MSTVLRRVLVVGFLIAALVAAGATSVTAQQAGERVVMTPADGALATRFVFFGSGFTPGQTVSVRFIAPDGAERRLRTEEGVEFVWLVAADGTFTLELVPAQRFPAAPPGRWRALFCGFGALTCQQLEFDLVP